jgi:type I restriction enzyme, S subunit
MLGEEINREAAKSVQGEANGLPVGWVWTTIGEIAEVNPRDRAIRDLPDDLPVSFVPMAAVDAESGTIASPDVRVLGQVRKGFTPFADGDVIMAKITPSMENGKAAIAHALTNGLGFGSTEFHVMRPTAAVMPEYLFHFIRQVPFREEAKANFAGTAGQLRVPARFVEEHALPLPPISEQQRIVTKLEELLTRLDAGVAGLHRLQVALKRYRAAVLKAACEGRLVPQDPTDEPAAQLLERILAERRARWAAALRAKGKDPAKAKYEEPQAPDTAGLPALPEGWCWATVEQVCDRIVDCLHSTPTFTDHGYFCLDSNWIKPGRILYEDARFVDEPTFIDRNRRMVPRTNDVVFSREGARLGVAVRVPAEFEFCLGQRMMIFRLSGCVESSYFESFLNSQPFQAQYAPLITGTASPHLNTGDIRGFLVPLPPFSEQHRISDDVERRLTILESLKTAIGLALLRADRLRQAVLRRAFEGKL